MNLSAVFGVVHGANMAKRNPATGKFEKRESDGKIIKPPGWSPPDVEGELKRQLAEAILQATKDAPGEGEWVNFGPADGAYQRVHGATAELIVWVLCFQMLLPSAFFLVKLGADWQDEDSSYIDAAAGRGALVLAFTWLRNACLLYTSPSPRDATLSRMPSSA